MVKIASRNGYEVFRTFDESAQVYELFTDEDGIGYIGCADTRAEALVIAQEWLDAA